MNLDTELKLQAFLDGELSLEEGRAMAVLVQQDPAAAALLAELKNTRQALREVRVPATMPATREFYWSRIQQGIDRQGDRPVKRREPGVLANLRFLVLPTAAVVVLIILGLVVRSHVRPTGPTKSTVGTPVYSDTALAVTSTNGNTSR